MSAVWVKIKIFTPRRHVYDFNNQNTPRETVINKAAIYISGSTLVQKKALTEATGRVCVCGALMQAAGQKV
jgi:hypothetical protein